VSAGFPVRITLDELYRTAASLVSDDGENPEYDRGVIELVCDLLGVAHEGGREIVADQIKIAQHAAVQDRREHQLD
jgi:hypothetical protein